MGRNDHAHAHAKELSASVCKNKNANLQAWLVVFTKVPECVVGPRDDAFQHVLGYTTVNGVTARDMQMRHQQWDYGKSF